MYIFNYFVLALFFLFSVGAAKIETREVVFKDPRMSYKLNDHFRETVLHIERIDFNGDGIDDYFISSNESDRKNGRVLKDWDIYVSVEKGFKYVTNFSTSDLVFVKPHNKQAHLITLIHLPDGVAGYNQSLLYMQDNEPKTLTQYMRYVEPGTGVGGTIEKSLLETKFGGGVYQTSRSENISLKDLLPVEDWNQLIKREEYVYNKYSFKSSDKSLKEIGWKVVFSPGVREEEGPKGLYSINQVFLDLRNSKVDIQVVRENILENKGDFVPQSPSEYALFAKDPFLDGWPKEYILDKSDRELGDFSWMKIYSNLDQKFIGFIRFGKRQIIEFDENIQYDQAKAILLENDGVYKSWLFENSEKQERDE